MAYGEGSLYPPDLHVNCTASVFNKANEFNNARLENNIIYRNMDELRNVKVVIIETNEDTTVPCILFSYARTMIKNGHCIFSTMNDIEYDKQIIRSKNTQWYLHVPICFENGNVIKTRVFADSGANTPCLDTDWAAQNFPSSILQVKAPKQVHVPVGFIKPKYCLWMSFPTKYGK